jgi:hypothetical protein
MARRGRKGKASATGIVSLTAGTRELKRSFWNNGREAQGTGNRRIIAGQTEIGRTERQRQKAGLHLAGRFQLGRVTLYTGTDIAWREYSIS